MCEGLLSTRVCIYKTLTKYLLCAICWMFFRFTITGRELGLKRVWKKGTQMPWKERQVQEVMDMLLR